MKELESVAEMAEEAVEEVTTEVAESGKEKKQRARKKKEKSQLIEWIETALYAIIAVGVAYLIVTYVGQRTIVDGYSMYPTFMDGDNVITDKISYRFSDPERFDVIVFSHYDYLTGETHAYIKRIIGLPGETVQIIDGYVYINGEKLKEDTYGRMEPAEAGYAEEPITIGEDQYFVLGDNREAGGSRDSRYLLPNGEPDVGLVERDIIIGKAVLRIWPLADFGTFD